MLRPYWPPNIHFRPYRQHCYPMQHLTRALRVEIEAPHRCDLVDPPFDARGAGHAESVHVENAAANAVLRDLGDCGHALVSHGVEALRGVRQAPLLFTNLDHEAPLLERRGYGSPLRGRARGGDHHADRAAQQCIDRFDAFAGQLVMRLHGTERLALGVQRGRFGAEQGLQISEPAFRVRRRGRNDGEHALWEAASERGHQHGRARAGQATDTHARSRRWQSLDERAGGGQLLEPLEQEVESHQRVRVATASSIAASSKASTSSTPLASARRAPENRSAASAFALNTSTRSRPPNAAVASVGVAGVRSDSRGSGPKTVAPTVSAPRVRNSTPGAPSAELTSASPITIRLTSASMNGTNPGAVGNAVHAVSRRLPSSTTFPERTNQGSSFTVASTSSDAPWSR